MVAERGTPKARRNIERPTPARAKRTLKRQDIGSTDDDDVAHRVNEPGAGQAAEARVMAPLCRVARGASKRKPRQHARQPENESGETVRADDWGWYWMHGREYARDRSRSDWRAHERWRTTRFRPAAQNSAKTYPLQRTLRR